VSFRKQPTAQVDDKATIGDGTTVWDLAQIREDARLGSGCIVGRGAYVGPGVRIGDNVKLQNYALVYEPAVLADGVFGRAAAGLPKASVVQEHLGDLYLQIKRYADAAAAFDRALAGDRDSVDAGALTKKRDRARALAGQS
jgi:tetrahydrodipicolinate N-succinyltransferase